MRSSCIIDNWSLYMTASFLEKANVFIEYYLSDHNPELDSEVKQSVERSFGALSNLINAIIFYDDVFYLQNGNDDTWKYYNRFKDQSKNILSPKKLPDGYNKIYSNYDDVYNPDVYFLMSRLVKSDLFLSPQRSELIANQTSFDFKNITYDLLKELDEEINKILKQEKDTKLKIGIESNQILPSLTQLVFNEINDIKDIFNVAMQYSNSTAVQEYKSKINDLIQNVDKTENYLKLKKDFKNIYEDSMIKLGIKKREFNNSYKVAFNLWIFKISDIKFPFSSNLFKSKKQLILLKNLVKCRLEIYNVKDSLKKIFK